MRDALDRGARRLILGIGGSATNDAGIGMARALGARFLDASGEAVEPNGSGLIGLDAMDLTGLHPGLREATVLVACDVDNPLFGPSGAAYVYAPQKGADAVMVKQLDEGLRNFDRVVRKTTGRSVASCSGAGAAGGMGAGLLVFAGARLVSGFELVFNELGLDSIMEGIDLVLSGEGRIDEQTMRGKVLSGIARHAFQRGVPLVALCGQYRGDLSLLHEAGVSAVFGVNHGDPEQADALQYAAANVTDVSEQAIRLWLRSENMTDRRRQCP